MSDRSVNAIGAVILGSAAALVCSVVVLIAGGGLLNAAIAYVVIGNLAVLALVAPPIKRQAAFVRRRVHMPHFALARR